MFSLAPLIVLGAVACFIERISHGETFRFEREWVPSLGVGLSFYVDGLSLLFAVLIACVGFMVFVYAPTYLGTDTDRWRLYSWLLLFMASMLGVVLSDNILTMFVFWELTSISSYLLIGFRHEQEKARRAALQALLVTGFGGLAMLAGLLLLAHVGGSYEFSTLLQSDGEFHSDELLIPGLVLILAGVFTKSAQFPFHFWLPNAMEAPAPVSAFLHSATMVKAGVYLVARLTPVMTGVVFWEVALTTVGAITAMLGGYLALQEVDLKRLLAYSTVSALGTLMLLLGVGTPLAIQAAVIFLVGHAFYKSALFLAAGTVDHCTGSRDIRRLAGLFRVMPWIATTSILAGVSMAGLPPTGGFLAKELVYDSMLSPSSASWALLVATFFINVSFVCVACLVTIRPSLGNPTEAVREAQPAIPGLILPPLVLSVSGILTGMFPDTLSQYLTGPAVLAISPNANPVRLKLWHGFSMPFVLSIATFLMGGLLYAQHSRIRAMGRHASRLTGYGPAAGYERCLMVMKAVAAWQTTTLQNGRLRYYLTVVLTTFAVIVSFEFASHLEIPTGPPWLDIQFHEYFPPALILAATIMAVRTQSRLTAVCALGVIGYAMAMLFVMFRAPDLAMTQFAIETLTVILFVSVIYRFPHFVILSSRMARMRDAALALIVGGLMGGVVLAATASHSPSRVSQFFVDHSLTSAKGENMVNVILVDFRGLDTLGEVTVLAVAALGIYTLMRLRIDGQGRDIQHRTSDTAPNDSLTSNQTDSSIEGNS